MNLVHEPETWGGSDDELTTEWESDIAEDSYRRDYSAFVLTLKEDRFPIIEVEERDMIEENVSDVSKSTLQYQIADPKLARFHCSLI